MKRKPAKETAGITEQGSALSEVLQRLNGSADGAEDNDPSQLAEQVENLAFHGLDLGAIALLLDCDALLLESAFAYAIEHGRARWRKFLMEKLVEKVDDGDWPALKFALKNSCGMADNPLQAALQAYKLAQLRKQAADARGSAPQPEPPEDYADSPEMQPLREEAAHELVPAMPQSVQQVRGGKTNDSSLQSRQTGGADAPNDIAG